MKRYLKIIGIGLLSFTLLAGCADKSGKTLASIDDQKITYGEYLKEMAMYKLQVDTTFASNPKFWEEKVPADKSVSGKETTVLENFKSELLENMIEDKIIAKEVKNLALKVDDSQVDKNLKQYTQLLDSVPDIKKYFTDNKLDTNFIKSMSINDLTKAAFEKDFTDKNQVSQAEIDAYYEKNKSEFSDNQLKASHILIKTVNEDGSEMSKEKVEAAKKQIDEIYERAIAGEDFAELAKKYGQDGTKDKGGDLGYFTRGDMVKEFSDAAFALKMDEISKPVKTQFGYHIIKKTGDVDVAQVKEYIKSLLQKNKFNDYIKELKEKSKITIDEELLKGAEKDIVPHDTKAAEETKKSNNPTDKQTQDGATDEKKTESETTKK